MDIHRPFLLNCLMILVLCSSSSCVLLKPLKLKPPASQSTHTSLQNDPMAHFNGHYRLQSVKKSGVYLDEVFLRKNVISRPIDDTKSSSIALQVIDATHIKAALYENGKITHSKMIKGVLQDGYFYFHSATLKWKNVFWIHGQQTSRMSVTTNHQLLLDNISGHIGFFLILPIPLSGSSTDEYDLIYERIQ